jgi:hypothetical protein
MTVEVEYYVPFGADTLGQWQLDMAKQIENNRGFPISDITRELSGSTFIVRVETDLPDQAVDNMLSDIEEYLPSTASHVGTREV